MCAARSDRLTALRSPSLGHKQLAQISRWNEAPHRGLILRYVAEQFYDLPFDIVVIFIFLFLNRIYMVEQPLDLLVRNFDFQTLDTVGELLQIQFPCVPARLQSVSVSTLRIDLNLAPLASSSAAANCASSLCTGRSASGRHSLGSCSEPRLSTNVLPISIQLVSSVVARDC